MDSMLEPFVLADFTSRVETSVHFLYPTKQIYISASTTICCVCPWTACLNHFVLADFTSRVETSVHFLYPTKQIYISASTTMCVCPWTACLNHLCLQISHQELNQVYISFIPQNKYTFQHQQQFGVCPWIACLNQVCVSTDFRSEVKYLNRVKKLQSVSADSSHIGSRLICFGTVLALVLSGHHEGFRARNMFLMLPYVNYVSRQIIFHMTVVVSLAAEMVVTVARIRVFQT